MKNRFRGFYLLMLSSCLVLGLGLASCGPKIENFGAQPSCANQTVTIDPGANPPVVPDPVFVCAGNNVTWSSTVGFDITFPSAPLTGEQPSSSNPHPARATTLPPSGTINTVTGYDAAMVWPYVPHTSCGTKSHYYCYKYTIQFNNGTHIDPHVIIMPPN